MKINIKMLNVGDGDAIIVLLKKTEDQQLVILIDGGHAGNAEHCIETLQPILIKAKKEAPDLIICTHYDSDHIGGLKKIATYYGNKIGSVWLHQPVLINIIESIKPETATVFENHVDLLVENSALKPESIALKTSLYDRLSLKLESYTQLKDLLKVLHDLQIPSIEPFAGTKLDGWPEISVLGPTHEFYSTLYNKISKNNELLINEADSLLFNIEEPNLNLAVITEHIKNPCKYLDQQRKDTVTAINQVSVIIQIIAEEKKYLFTGDASLQSFESIPGYPDCLKDIYWLKVPHHGSHNNISTDLILIMKPQHAFISGGTKYLDNEVRDCLLAHGSQVQTTRDKDEDLSFHG